MARYVNRNQITVSQEFTLIELVISAGIIALAMKLLKSNEKKVEQVKPKLEVEEYDERKIINSRYKTIIEALEKGATTSGSPVIYAPYWGEGSTVNDYIKHTAVDYLSMVKKVIDKTKVTMDSLVNENEKYDSEQGNEDTLSKLIKKLESEIASVTGKQWQLNNLRFTPHNPDGLMAINFDEDHKMVGSEPIPNIPNPTSKEVEKLVILLGELINYRSDLSIRIEAWPDSAWNGYANTEIRWISYVVDNLESVAWYLSVYLMSSLGLKI